MLSAVAFIAKKFGRGSSWQDEVADALLHLGEAAEVSRVYIYQNSEHQSELVMSAIYEWCAPDIDPMIVDPDNQNYPYSHRLQRWAEILGGGEVVHGRARDLPACEPEDLTEEGVLSTAVIPIFCDDVWWGYIGFDDCLTERGWSEVELDTLRAAAEIIGGAIERQRSAEKLERNQQIFKALAEQLPAILYIEGLDREDRVEDFISPRIESMTGISQKDWLSEAGTEIWLARVHPDDRERVRVVWMQGRLTAKDVCDYRMVHPDGRVVWFRDRSTVIYDKNDEPFMEVGLMLDITEQKEAEQQIAFLAYHDKLTGLANRALFEEMLEAAMARATRDGLAIAVLYMDLDDFKAVNDSLGHSAGDDLLKQIAARIVTATRGTDLVARQGGDEFLVLLPDLPLIPVPGDLAGGDVAVRVAKVMAGRIRELISEPFALGKVELQTSLSIGDSIYPVDAASARDLLKNADLAMYKSKQALAVKTN